MTDNISSLIDHPKYKGVKHADQPVVQSRFSETDDLPPAIIQAIDVRIDAHRRKKLHQDDRRALAENLGVLLQGVKEQRGLLTKLFLEAGIASNKEESTKRLPRYVRFPEARQEYLASMIGRYHALGTATAASLGLSKGRLYARLFKGTTFLADNERQAGVDPAEAAVRDGLQPLLAMLEMMVASTVRRHDLHAYFRTIAHYALESRTEGESYFTNDHPFAWDLSAQERWIDARLDLLPAATLYSLDLDHHPPIVAEVVIDGHEYETTVCLREDCALVIAPLGQNGRPEACLVGSKRIDLESRTAPGLKVSFFPWNEFAPQAGATVVGELEGSYRSMTIKSAQSLDVLVGMAGDLSAVDVSPVTLDSLYEALHRRPLKHGMARSIDDNLDLTFQFRSPTAAQAQSLAAYIERNLRELARDDPARLDNQLHADVQRLAQELEACRTAIRDELAGSFDRFRREQEGAEVVTLHDGVTGLPEASDQESQP